ncbi:MAG: Extradiol ring-cleavage dioxygenase class protein subunit [Firmicutes bacterium]|nr:Extradiol ring-cleavage dioxygenase class protein subunit [Bacillota bacterium]
MKHLVACALLPHPPIMVPEVGKNDCKKVQATIVATQQVAQAVKDAKAQTVVLMSPHGPVFKDAIGLSVYPRLKGNFAAFGAPDVVLGYETDRQLLKQILHKAERLGVNVIEITDEVAKTYRFALELDHGAMVPLYYLQQAGFRGQLVHISVGMLPYEEMYTFGKAVQAAIGLVNKKVAVIASGDLSHRLAPNAPAGYSPRGAEFDRLLLEKLASLDTKGVINIDKKLVAEAGECGLRPTVFLMGVMGELKVDTKVLSYEGPFGVGYGVVLCTMKKDDDSAK